MEGSVDSNNPVMQELQTFTHLSSRFGQIYTNPKRAAMPLQVLLTCASGLCYHHAYSEIGGFSQ